jgi:hypothetical protein
MNKSATPKKKLKVKNSKTIKGSKSKHKTGSASKANSVLIKAKSKSAGTSGQKEVKASKQAKAVRPLDFHNSLMKFLSDINSGALAKPNSLLEFVVQVNFQPTEGQKEACVLLDKFFADRESRCFLLKGHAGSGKTSLIKLIYFYTTQILELACGLMAPTSRAARVIEKAVGGGAMAGTIHGTIYRLKDIVTLKDTDSATNISPAFAFPVDRIASSAKGSVFIVDEASMVSNQKNDGGFYRFGSGRLLLDLFEATSPINPKFSSKVIFVGDPCQLEPPTGGKSVALDEDYLRSMGLNPVSITLTEVKRQEKKSGILNSAQDIRDVIVTGQKSGVFSRFHLDFTVGDIDLLSDGKVCEDVAGSFKKDESDGIVISGKNETVFELNEVVRKIIWNASSPPLQVGDRLLAYRNNPRSGIINGEFVIVVEVSPKSEKHVVPVLAKDPRTGHVSPSSLHFRKIEFRPAGVSDPNFIVEVLYIEEFLNRKGRELTDDEFRGLYDDCVKRFLELNPGVAMHVNPKPASFIDFLRKDPFINAALFKYGYAMTCQKAQGGQWNKVGVVFDSFAGIRKEGFHRWAYTAITRASRQLNVCNPPIINPMSLLKGGAKTKFVPIRKRKPKIAINVANPISQQMFLEGTMQDEFKKHRILFSLLPGTDEIIRYEFRREEKWCVMIFDLKKFGFFSNIRSEKRKRSTGKPATDDDFGGLVKKLLEEMFDPTGEGVEYIELTPDEQKDESPGS